VHRPAPRRAAVALATLLALLSGPNAGTEVIDRVVAMIGDRAITASDLRAAIDLGLVTRPTGPDADAVALRTLIDRTLVEQEVARYGPGAPDESLVRQRLAQIEERLGPGGLTAVMARSGLDEPRLRAIVRADIEIERYLADRFGAAAQPTDDEVLQYYREHQEEFERDGQVVAFAEAEASARAALSERRRQRLIDDWIEGLRRREAIRLVSP
jgi:hypothetical protein